MYDKRKLVHGDKKLETGVRFCWDHSTLTVFYWKYKCMTWHCWILSSMFDRTIVQPVILAEWVNLVRNKQQCISKFAFIIKGRLLHPPEIENKTDSSKIVGKKCEWFFLLMMRIVILSASTFLSYWLLTCNSLLGLKELAKSP